MKQQTFSDIEYSNRRKKTKRDEFLEIMNEIIPWDEWVSHIKPHYYDGKRGRPPIGIEKMLRMYLLQIWFTLSDEGVEDAIYDSYAMRKFMGIDFMVEQVPDATTLLHFRRLIEESGLGKAFFDAINRCLTKCGHMMKGGTIVDATLISAPSSTKNASGSRDPEMKQTKKGNQWHFGMKCHMGVDAGTGYIHSIEATAANVHDVAEASKLIRADDACDLRQVELLQPYTETDENAFGRFARNELSRTFSSKGIKKPEPCLRFSVLLHSLGA